MLNNKLKKEAIQTHKAAVEHYNTLYNTVTDCCQKLYTRRKNAMTTFARVESLINSIANTPKEFEATLSNIKKERGTFRKTESYAKEAVETARKATKQTAAGAAGGAAVAAMAPTAAMWVATTFGTASTGTAISTLSGAAATKAALAWLGGGAIRAGGLGIAGGKALLALAGPIGWSIAGVTGVTSAFFLSRKNKEIAEEAYAETKKIKTACSELQDAIAKINQLIEKTKALRSQVEDTLADNEYLHSANYSELSTDERFQLGALVNNTLSLAQLINETV